MSSRTAVVLLGFGEPEGADQEEVTGFLERIFLANAGLEDQGPGGAEARARFLANARAPALTEIYQAIGRVDPARSGNTCHARHSVPGSIDQ